MTLRKLIENTTADSNPSWTTRWTTFTGGWWKSSPTAILPPSANILTPRPANRGDACTLHHFVSRAFVLSLCAALLLIGCFDALAQSASHKKKKSARPKSPACPTGCKPETTPPAVDTESPDDAALQ